MMNIYLVIVKPKTRSMCVQYARVYPQRMELNLRPEACVSNVQGFTHKGWN